MNSFFAHIAAARLAITFVAVVGYDAVARASWHLALVTNAVAFGWGHGAESDEANRLLGDALQEARSTVIAVALQYGLFEAYQNQVTLNNHWRLPSRAPSVAGLPDFNIHWSYLDENGNVRTHQRILG